MRRWRDHRGKFKKSPGIETGVYPRKLGRKLFTAAIYWDFNAKRYRDGKTHKFVSPKPRDLLIPRSGPRRKPVPKRKGRWKVSFGGYGQGKKQRQFLEWDIIGNFGDKDDLIAYLSRRSKLFAEVLESGAYPMVAYVDLVPKSTPRGYVGRRVRAKLKFRSTEIDRGV